MSSRGDNFSNLVSQDDLIRIESTNLSVLKRHHLRLLIHCLESFKAMTDQSILEEFPSEAVRQEWLLSHPDLKKDKDFVHQLLKQLSVAADYLEILAAQINKKPLLLTLDDLIDNAIQQERSDIL